MIMILRLGATALLILSFAAPASAQLGIKGGVNLTNFVGDDADKYESTPGLNLGASLSLASLGPVQLLGEVYYRQKGAEYDLTDPSSLGNPGGQGGTFEIGLDYVEIPLLVRLDLRGPGSRVLPYLVGGPAFGWQLDCGVSASGTDGTTQPDCDDLTENFGNTIRNYEAGLVLGGGLAFNVARLGAVSLDARYTRGLSKIGEGGDALNIRNQAFTLMLGYAFGIPGTGGMRGMGR